MYARPAAEARFTYTAKDVCEDVLHVSQRTLQCLVPTGRFPAPIRAAKKPIWTSAQDERFLSGKSFRRPEPIPTRSPVKRLAASRG